MAKTLTLQEKTMVAIKPWTDFDEEPPFTERELVILASASTDMPMDDQAVFMWILHSFPYFKELAFEAFWACDHGYRTLDGQGIKDNLKIVFQTYDTAFIASENDEMEIELMATDAAVHMVLKQLTGYKSSRDSTFSFFKLPAELRNAIYELAFHYSSSGLIWESANGRFELFTRNIGDTAMSISRWNEVGTYSWYDKYETLPVGELLASLLTCRQFYAEAMPVFYRVNHFVLDGSDRVIRCLAASRSKHIHSISARINFSNDHEKMIGAAFKSLADLDSLRVLDLSIDEEAWLGRSRNGQVKKYSSISNYPGLKQLRRIRGLSTLYMNGAPQIEALVRADMLSPKPTASTRSGSGRKRKNGD
ncbi:hypothetical protein LTR97_007341 [Elasticomyces elasticus]|uniref:DUF7730 domain-containing protein n=1 Tax=Elasticomyces elasticus TaxID=574655 RepID=A0AAN7ZMS3_9PEZI|nr:hypothetical protein LTR97_007341 [Elasticomyces elasticus]